MGEYSIGMIGGSGLYEMEGLEIHEERVIETPFGEPSDAYILGEVEGNRVAFLARHGRGHRISPSELNFRANIYGFKTLGTERLLSVSAVGSMKEEYEPLHVVVPDQFYDRTRHRRDTFFGDGLVAHVSMADPVCPELRQALAESGDELGAKVHRGGTYLCMEGPQFSTRGESLVYRSWGMDVIGMTNLQEAKLAREAEICYATLAMVTDYDCWHEEEEDVTVDAVLAILRANAQMGQDIIRHSVRRLAAQGACECGCRDALAAALITDRSAIPETTLKRLGPIVSRYLDTPQND